MAKVKVTITTEDGEVLDQFTIEDKDWDTDVNLANMVRSTIEDKLPTED